MSKILASVLALSLIAIVVPAVADGERTETQHYVAGEGSTFYCAVVEEGVASSCFDVGPGAHSARIEVEDASGSAVGGWVQVLDLSDRTLYSEPFCGGEDALDLPEGSARITVALNGPHWAALDCPDDGFATQGTVTATLVGERGPPLERDASWVGLMDHERWEQSAKLTDAAPQSGAEFGNAVAVDGDTLVVGSHWRDLREPPEGVEIPQQRVCVVACITFGEAVERVQDAGAVTVFEQVGGDWVQVADFPGSQPDTWFGTNIALDGDTFVTNSPGPFYVPGEDDPCPYSTAELYVHERVDGAWQPTATLTAPGHVAGKSCLGGDEDAGNALAIAGDTIVAGSGHGANDAFVYQRQSNGTWALGATLTVVSEADDDSFGWSVDVSDDGDRIAVGHMFSLDDTRVHVYDRTVDGWAHTANLTSPYQVGMRVAISGDGDTVAATAAWRSEQPAQVWNHNDGAWSNPVALVPRDPTGPLPYLPGLAVDATGDTLALGAYLEDQIPALGPQAPAGDPLACGFPDRDLFSWCSGAAYVFKRTAEGWTQTTKVVQSDDVGGDYFGWSVDLDQGSLVVGAPGIASLVGSAVVVDAPGKPERGGGAVYLFHEANAGEGVFP